MSDVEAEARALYNACPSIKPEWDQLGDVTKGVWKERVAPAPEPLPIGHIESLF